jgi:ABC-type glycerol-3-phosphate transport system substrate-binding protein
MGDAMTMPKRVIRFTAAVVFALGGVWTPAMAQVTLIYSDWQLAEPVWGRSLREAFAEFEKQNPDIKIKPEAVALGQRDTRYTTALRAGKGPDVFALDANPIKQYIKEGWVKDLTPFIAKEGGSYLADWYPQLLGPVTEGSKVYGLPKNVSPIMLTYNSELFAAAGIAQAPKTWAEYRAVAKRLTLATKPGGPVDQWGTLLVLAPAGFDLRFSVILRGFGGDFLTPDNKHSALNTPEAKAAFNYAVELINNDKSMPPGVTQVDANGGRQLVASRKVAMAFEGLFTVPIIADMNPQLDAWRVLQMAPVPQNPGNEKKIRTTFYMKSIVMNPHTEHPEAAWKLIRFMMEPKQMEKWFTDNNLLSARKSVNDGYKAIAENRFATAARGEIDRAAFLPQIPQWPEIMETFRQALQAAIARSKPPEQALADAHASIEAILARP